LIACRAKVNGGGCHAGTAPCCLSWHIPRESYFFRIIKDLAEEGFIIKIHGKTSKRGGRPQTWYRLVVPAIFFDETAGLGRRYVELSIAKKLLKEHGVKDPDTAIEERFKEEYGIKIEPDTED